MRIRWRVVGPVALVLTAAVWWVGVDGRHAGGRGGRPGGAGQRRHARAAHAAPAASAGAARPSAAPASTIARPGSRCGSNACSARRRRWTRTRRPRATRSTRGPRANTRINGCRTRSSPPTMPLRMPGTGVVPNMRVHTTQQRVFATGADTVLFTVSRHRRQRRAAAAAASSARSPHSPQDTGGGKAAPLAPVVTQAFVDDGTQGDLQAGDGVYTGRLDPHGRRLRQLRRHDPHRAARAVGRAAGLRRVRRRLFAAGARHLERRGARRVRTARWTSCSAPT